MNLSPRRISASLRGRNRHITLMLHSAGSAISAGRREGARGAGAGPGVGEPGEEAASRTARSQAASCRLRRSFSAAHGELCGWAALAAARPGRRAADRHAAPRAAHLPSRVLPQPCAAPRDHAAGGPGDARGASRARLRPPGPRRAQPSRISTSALRRRSALPSPGPPRAETSLRRSDLAPSARRPGTCSRSTCRCKGEDAWSGLSRTAVVPQVRPPRACRCVVWLRKSSKWLYPVFPVKISIASLYIFS